MRRSALRLRRPAALEAPPVRRRPDSPGCAHNSCPPCPCRQEDRYFPDCDPGTLRRRSGRNGGQSCPRCRPCTRRCASTRRRVWRYSTRRSPPARPGIPALRRSSTLRGPARSPSRLRCPLRGPRGPCRPRRDPHWRSADHRARAPAHSLRSAPGRSGRQSTEARRRSAGPPAPPLGCPPRRADRAPHQDLPQVPPRALRRLPPPGLPPAPRGMLPRVLLRMLPRRPPRTPLRTFPRMRPRGFPHRTHPRRFPPGPPPLRLPPAGSHPPIRACRSAASQRTEGRTVCADSFFSFYLIPPNCGIIHHTTPIIALRPYFHKRGRGLQLHRLDAEIRKNVGPKKKI